MSHEHASGPILRSEAILSVADVAAAICSAAEKDSHEFTARRECPDDLPAAGPEPARRIGGRSLRWPCR